MKFLILISLILSSSYTVYSDDLSEEFMNKIMSQVSLNDENETQSRLIQEQYIRNKFQCKNLASISPRPTSVHALKPSDIEVIGAIGDSLTAANGAKAITILGLLEECRGVSWSMGGEKSDVNQLITLPNILRQFNPNLFGYSLGSGTSSSSNAVFNAARPGETSFEMLTQAKNLVNLMRQSSRIDFANSWKLITFFIGGNDLCKSCKDSKYTATNILNNIKQTLDYFKANLPRTLVNMVLSLDVTGIEELPGFTCRNMQKVLCDCALSESYRSALLGLTKSIQNGVEDYINTGVYDNSNNFTVVVQPFMKKMKPPKKDDGSVDYSYFAPDCFHLSLKGHQASAVELWNSMLTPVGKKQEYWTNINQNIACPTEDSPYIFTNKNSRPSLLKSLLNRN